MVIHAMTARKKYRDRSRQRSDLDDPAQDGVLVEMEVAGDSAGGVGRSGADHVSHAASGESSDHFPLLGWPSMDPASSPDAESNSERKASEATAAVARPLETTIASRRRSARWPAGPPGPGANLGRGWKPSVQT